MRDVCLPLARDTRAPCFFFLSSLICFAAKCRAEPQNAGYANLPSMRQVVDYLETEKIDADNDSLHREDTETRCPLRRQHAKDELFFAAVAARRADEWRQQSDIRGVTMLPMRLSLIASENNDAVRYDYTRCPCDVADYAARRRCRAVARRRHECITEDAARQRAARLRRRHTLAALLRCR